MTLITNHTQLVHGARLTGLQPDPQSASEAVPRGYVDGVFGGGQVKPIKEEGEGSNVYTVKVDPDGNTDNGYILIPEATGLIIRFPSEGVPDGFTVMVHSRGSNYFQVDGSFTPSVANNIISGTGATTAFVYGPLYADRDDKTWYLFGNLILDSIHPIPAPGRIEFTAQIINTPNGEYYDPTTKLLWYIPNKDRTIGPVGSNAELESDDLIDLYRIMWDWPSATKPTTDQGDSNAASSAWNAKQPITVPGMEGSFLMAGASSTGGVVDRKFGKADSTVPFLEANSRSGIVITVMIAYGVRGKR